jgi:transcriptional regulator with XRE-family HTH domain
MSKKIRTLGPVLKERRQALALTQRQLARRLGVEASHIAYLEHGQRRPSLALLGRLADVLGLDKQDLFLLSHPEAKHLIAAGPRSTPAKSTSDLAWREFIANRTLLERYGVTRKELKILEQVSLLRRVTSPRHFLHVLLVIREPIDEG